MLLTGSSLLSSVNSNCLQLFFFIAAPSHTTHQGRALESWFPTTSLETLCGNPAFLLVCYAVSLHALLPFSQESNPYLICVPPCVLLRVFDFPFLVPADTSFFYCYLCVVANFLDSSILSERSHCTSSPALSYLCWTLVPHFRATSLRMFFFPQCWEFEALRFLNRHLTFGYLIFPPSFFMSAPTLLPPFFFLRRVKQVLLICYIHWKEGFHFECVHVSTSPCKIFQSLPPPLNPIFP